MAKLDQLIADVNTFRSDVTDALTRAQKSIDDLKAAQGTLTPEQQAAVDAADAALKAADDTVKAFDVPPTPAP